MSAAEIATRPMAGAHGKENTQPEPVKGCLMCCLASKEPWAPMLDGVECKILSENPGIMVMKTTKAMFSEGYHTHSHSHYLYILKGKLRFDNYSVQQSVEATAGDLLHVKGGEIHRQFYESECEMLGWIEGPADFTYAKDVDHDRVLPLVTQTTIATPNKDAMKKMVDAAKDKRDSKGLNA